MSYCHRCAGRGYIIVCMDYLCLDADECIHRDGDMVCPDCLGHEEYDEDLPT